MSTGRLGKDRNPKGKTRREVADIEQQHKTESPAWDLRLRLQRDLDRE